MSAFTATLIVAESKATLPADLNRTIADLAKEALAARGAFAVALSGGSLPGFLATLGDDAFDGNGDDAAPQWDKWHIFLADERCVPETHADSNLGSLRTHFLTKTAIPAANIHGIDETKLSLSSSSSSSSAESSTEAIAVDYERVVRETLQACGSGGALDLAVLGFGPDGHTCSLFPDHALLQERTKWVAPITDSPKPPPNRVTLTLTVLNRHTRHAIVCGAGESKGPVLNKVVILAAAAKKQGGSGGSTGSWYDMDIRRDPAPFPCAMVHPQMESSSTLTWVVDADAFRAANIQIATSLVANNND